MPRGGSNRFPLRGYTRVSKNRWRVESSGREITDYEYRSRVVRKLGWKNASEADRFRKSQTWKKWILDISESKKNFDSKGRYVGVDLSYKGSAMRDAFLVRQRQLEGEYVIPEGPETPLIDTELGRLLIASGRRPEDAWWEMGDSPR